MVRNSKFAEMTRQEQAYQAGHIRHALESSISYEMLSSVFRHDPINDVLEKNYPFKGWAILGYANKTPYQRDRAFGTKIMRHRIVWMLHYRSWPVAAIDHIDGNSKNNKINNLRECTVAENGQNRRINSNNKTGITGVRFNRGKWEVNIRKNKGLFYIGRFDDKSAAINALKESKRLLHTFHPEVVSR